MSLASQMSSGELGDWFRDRLGDHDGAREILEDIRAALYGRPAAVVGSAGRSAQDAALIDLAITQRFAFAVEPAPPYYALLGAHLSDLVDVARAHVAAGSFPTHTPLPMVVSIRRLDRRPTPAGWIDAASPQPWKSYHDELFGPMTLASDPPSAWDRDPEHQGRAPSEVLGLCHWLSSALRDHARPGHLAGLNRHAPTNHAAAATETTLAAACLALASWEHAYRQRCALPTDPIWDPIAARDGVEAIQTVLAAASPELVAKVEAMTVLAAESGTVTRLRALVGQASTRVPLGRRGPVPLGYARPVLVPHWADATAIVGDAGTPGGTTLLALHTPAAPPDPAQALAWCHELLALAWLDAHDLYRVGHVALYLARHGTLVTWPVTELAALLASLSPDDHDRLDALRDELIPLDRLPRHHRRRRRPAVGPPTASVTLSDHRYRPDLRRDAQPLTRPARRPRAARRPRRQPAHLPAPTGWGPARIGIEHERQGHLGRVDQGSWTSTRRPTCSTRTVGRELEPGAAPARSGHADVAPLVAEALRHRAGAGRATLVLTGLHCRVGPEGHRRSHAVVLPA